MAQHMLTPPDQSFTDKRRSPGSVADENTRRVGKTFFTTNAAGTTTTAVGADATIGTGVNVVRLGDKFKLFNSSGTLKEEKVFEITGVSSATGTTTVTFTPAAAVATASGDTLRFVGVDDYKDNESLDERLNAIDSTLYSQANLDKMTQNDKVYAIRLNDDPGSL